MKEQTSATTETLSKGRTIIDFTGKTIFRPAGVSSLSLVRLAGTLAFLLKQLLRPAGVSSLSLVRLAGTPAFLLKQLLPVQVSDTTKA